MRTNCYQVLILCMAGLLPFYGFSQPDIPMSIEFKSNSESWKVKVRQNGIWGKKPALVSFGPVKTISADYENNGTTAGIVDRELFWKNIHATTSRESSMLLELNSSDTVLISMITIKEEITKEKNVMGTLANSNSDVEQFYQVNSRVDEMIMKFQNDSAIWHYKKMETGSAFGILENNLDTSVHVFFFKVNNLDGRKMKEIMFSQPALGCVIEYKEKQVAAFQTILKQMCWVSPTLEPLLRKAILSTVACIMATVKSAGANGY